MSIEELLLEVVASLNNNTFAVKELTKRLDAQKAPVSDPQPVKAERTIEAPKPTPAPKEPTPAPKEPTPAPKEPSPPVALTYADVAKVLQALMAEKGRDALIAVLTKFGAKNGKELKEADYAAVLDAAKEA